jgi:hypothetical protein
VDPQKRRGNGQPDRERGAPALPLARDIDDTAVELDQVADERQAQAVISREREGKARR